MATLSFPSLEDGKIAYTCHSSSTDLWDAARGVDYPLASWAGLFATYGDGLTQHSPESVVTKHQFVDYLASLAAYLEHRPEEREIVARRWPQDVHRGSVLFAHGIRFQEGKKRYYRLSERKVSTRDTLRFDKRWQTVEEWADGSVIAVCRLIGTHNHVLDNYALFEQVRNLLAEESGHYGPTPGELLAIPGDMLVVRQAFAALDGFVRAHRAEDYARGQLKCYRQNAGKKAAG